MNLSRINKIQGLKGRDYEIEFLRALTGKDLQDVLLTFEDLTSEGNSILYEEITLPNYKAAASAGTLTAGKTYNITGLLSSIGTFKLRTIATTQTYNENVISGLLHYENLANLPAASWYVTFDVVNDVFLSFYNMTYDIRCNSEAVFQDLFSGNVGAALYVGRISSCDFSDYEGTLTFDSGNFTTLRNCDFSNSEADFTTTALTSAATFSGRIMNDFTVPNQASFPCDFTNTIQINADGTNNMMATITLAASQSTLDYTGFESAGIVKLIVDAGANNIDNIINIPTNRQYKIISDDILGLLSISTGGNVIFNSITNASVASLLVWNTTESLHNEVYFFYNGTDILITVNSNLYLT